MTSVHLCSLEHIFQLNDVLMADALQDGHLSINQLHNSLALNLQQSFINTL